MLRKTLPYLSVSAPRAHAKIKNVRIYGDEEDASHNVIFPFMIAFFLALFAVTTAFAQSNCPGTSYLGWGQTTYPDLHSYTLTVSFPNGAGYATLNAGVFEFDADAQYQTCNPNSWNVRVGGTAPFYGTVTYNDGTVNYSGHAAFWLDFAPAYSPNCVDHDRVYTHMVRRIKIQSCNVSHTALSNRFIAVSCDGSYCESITGTPCDSSSPYDYASENWLTLSVSGF